MGAQQRSRIAWWKDRSGIRGRLEQVLKIDLQHHANRAWSFDMPLGCCTSAESNSTATHPTASSKEGHTEEKWTSWDGSAYCQVRTTSTFAGSLELAESQGFGWHPVGDDAKENQTDGAEVSLMNITWAMVQKHGPCPRCKSCHSLLGGHSQHTSVGGSSSRPVPQAS